MTPAELLALANAATTGPWQADDRDSQIEVSSIEFHVAQIDVSYDSDFNREQCEADARLIALAPDLARIVAEMGEALDVLRNGYDDHERECASLWEEPSRSMPCDCAVGVIAAALAKLSELEAR